MELTVHVPLDQQLANKLMFDAGIAKAWSVGNVLFSNFVVAMRYANHRAMNKVVKLWELTEIPKLSLLDIIEDAY